MSCVTWSWRSRSCSCSGSERGALPEGLEAARIPVHADSLNVAMAASVALYEVAHRMAADG